VANQENLDNGDPHEEIVRLEEHIEELAAKIESCRKFVQVSRVAVAGGTLVLAAMVVGAIRSDLGLMAASVASFFGGIVVWGSNISTAKEASREIAAGRLKTRSFDRTYQSAGYLIGRCSAMQRRRRSERPSEIA
jgi:hypothetical protein